MKRTTQIPDWFELAKYQACESLSNEGWYWNLHYRRQIIRFIQSGRTPGYSQETEEIRAVQNEIRTNALPSAEWHNKIVRTAQELKNKSNTSAETIQEYSHKWDYLYGKPIEPITAKYAIKNPFINNLDAMDIDTSEWHRIAGCEPLDVFLERHGLYEHHASVKIDLRVPDSELITYFKNFLRKYRKQLEVSSIKKKPTPVTISRLWEYQILPYLDLFIWELEEKVKIKRSIMAITLYPEGRFGELGIAQTIHPFAMTALDDAFLKTIDRGFSNKRN